MDINLPGISGVEAVKRLKPELPATQFVMLTVYEMPTIFIAHWPRSYRLSSQTDPREELLSALEEVHRGGSPMTSNIARKVVQSFGHTSAAVADGEGFPHANRRFWSCWRAATFTKKLLTAQHQCPHREHLCAADLRETSRPLPRPRRSQNTRTFPPHPKLPPPPPNPDVVS